MCIAGGRIHDLPSAGSATAGATAPALSAHQIDAHEHLFFEGDARDRIYIVESHGVDIIGRQLPERIQRRVHSIDSRGRTMRRRSSSS